VYDAELVCPACGKYTRAEKPVEPKASGVSDAPGNRQVSGAKAGAPTSDVLKAAKGRNGTLELLQGKVRIRREGFGNLMLFGLKGDKEIRISQIGSIQFRRPGPILSGYIQFTFLGGTEAQGGQWQAGTDENSVVFDKTQQPDFEEMKSLIEAQIAAGERGEAATGGIGDLEKLAELRDRGIISEEEFSAKKKQILGNGAFEEVPTGPARAENLRPPAVGSAKATPRTTPQRPAAAPPSPAVLDLKRVAKLFPVVLALLVGVAILLANLLPSGQPTAGRVESNAGRDMAAVGAVLGSMDPEVRIRKWPYADSEIYTFTNPVGPGTVVQCGRKSAAFPSVFLVDGGVVYHVNGLASRWIPLAPQSVGKCTVMEVEHLLR